MNQTEEISTTPAPPVPPPLQEHADMLNEAQVIKVRDNIHVAFGYALANMIMIEGTDGIIIVDTTESGDVALQILDKFRKITQKPIKAIVITHYHHDHRTGTAALLETTGEDRANVKVIAHSTMEKEFAKETMRSETITIGAVYQYGTTLQPGTERVCCGIGPFLASSSNNVPHQFIKPTDTFDDKAEFDIAGIKFEVHHTPGETNDQITVWIPEWKVVMPADNIYKTFPNLYAIRGSPPRDCVKWYKSLDFVKRLKPEYMVPSHTKPVTGAARIHSIITSYRDAIQFVHDQTMRGLNNGLEVDEIVEKVNLPPVLKEHPYLQEFYGMVCWSVRAVAAGKIGWFDKNSLGLFPLPFEAGSSYLNDMMNKDFDTQLDGAEKLLITAEEVLSSLENMDPDFSNPTVERKATWSLQLSLQAMELTESNSELYNRGVDDASKSFYYLAGNVINPNARNFFLTKSKELYKKNLAIIISIKQFIDDFPTWPIEMLMERLILSFRAEEVFDQDMMIVQFEFPDVAQQYSYTMRHCILNFHEDPKYFPELFDVKAKMNSKVWIELLKNETTVELAIENGKLETIGDWEFLERFLTLLDIYKPNLLNRLKELS